MLYSLPKSDLDGQAGSSGLVGPETHVAAGTTELSSGWEGGVNWSAAAPGWGSLFLGVVVPVGCVLVGLSVLIVSIARYIIA